MNLDIQTIEAFRKTIWQFYTINKRSFAWRNTSDPYRILISEVMLQQTQTHRVEQKYAEFITTFPNFEILAAVELKDVLRVWQGLGYNRRAQSLHKIAQIIVDQYGGFLPKIPEVLETFPGIGSNTAASMCAFAFNLPVVFIETNIRTVFLHTFFNDKEFVHDKEIMPLIEQTVDKDNPREWYYALMDYGVMIKKVYNNPARKSAHHVIQSPFHGSDRQVRSKIVRALLKTDTMTTVQIQEVIKQETTRVERIINQLCKEKLIKKQGKWYRIA